MSQTLTKSDKYFKTLSLCYESHKSTIQICFEYLSKYRPEPLKPMRLWFRFEFGHLTILNKVTSYWTSKEHSYWRGWAQKGRNPTNWSIYQDYIYTKFESWTYPMYSTMQEIKLSNFLAQWTIFLISRRRVCRPFILIA